MVEEQAKQVMHSAVSSPLSDWCPSHPWACHCPSGSSPQFYCPAGTVCHGTSLGSAGVCCVPSQLPVYPQTLCCWGGWGAEKSFTLSRNCSAIPKTSCVNIILIPNAKYTTVPITRNKIKLHPNQNHESCLSILVPKHTFKSEKRQLCCCPPCDYVSGKRQF